MCTGKIKVWGRHIDQFGNSLKNPRGRCSKPDLRKGMDMVHVKNKKQNQKTVLVF